jgi:ssDNA-binding Zn-finger/Zn-ribbon topoisomerase 1
MWGGIGMSKNYIPCQDCGKAETYWQHDETAHTFGETNVPKDCNYEASYEGEENGYIGTCDHHEFDAVKESTG